jgi:hypothetical protein
MCCMCLQGELLRCRRFERAGIDDRAAGPGFPSQQMIDRAYNCNGAGRGNARTEAAVKEREATVP